MTEDVATTDAPVLDVQEEPVVEITESIIYNMFRNTQARRASFDAVKFNPAIVAAERKRKFAVDLICKTVRPGGYLLLHKAYAELMSQYPEFISGTKKGQYIRFDK